MRRNIWYIAEANRGPAPKLWLHESARIWVFAIFAGILAVSLLGITVHAVHHSNDDGRCHLCVAGAAALVLVGPGLVVYFATTRAAVLVSAPVPRRRLWQQIPSRAPPRNSFPK